MRSEPDPPAAGAPPGASPSGWPARLRAHLLVLRRAGERSERDAALAAAWDILGTVLLSFLRRHARRLGNLPDEDLGDLASQKSLEIARAAESGKWDPETRTPGEIAAYVSTVARNGLVDRLRESGRLVHSEGVEGEPLPPTPASGPGGGAMQEQKVQAQELASGLRQCAAQLDVRDRRIWFFRAFYEMRSRDIARHPAVLLKPAHVDVILKRARESLRECLRRRGLTSDDVRPGVFTELWFAFAGELAGIAPIEEGER